MLRNLAIAIVQAAILLSFTSTSVPAAQAEFGSEKEARSMLERAVSALKENKEKALERFNKGEGGFKDRDLYVFCANASDGVLTAHPYLKGEHLQEIVGKKGFPLGKEIMNTAAEGRIDEVTYWWPRPGSDKPLEKHTFFTKVVGQTCGVGYYNTAAAASAEAEVRQAVRDYDQALRRADVAAVEKFWASEYTFINPRGERVTRADRVANLRNQRTALDSLGHEPQEEQIQIYGDIAVYTTLLTLSGRYSGGAEQGRFRALVVWVRRDGRWQQLASQMTPVVAK